MEIDSGPRESREPIDAVVEVVIEQRRGDTERWEWSAGALIRRDSLRPPFPAAYGCIERVMNPADGEALDVFVASKGDYARGERLSARVIDVLERSDGDHKMLAVPLDDAQAPADGVRDRIWDWMLALERPVVAWA